MLSPSILPYIIVACVCISNISNRTTYSVYFYIHLVKILFTLDKGKGIMGLDNEDKEDC